MMEWYYAEGETQMGPVDDAMLASLVMQGRIAAETLVWNATMTNWQSYGEVVSGAATSAAGAMGGSGSTATGVVGGAYCAQCGRPGSPDEMVRYGDAYVCAECKPLFFQRIREGVNVSSEVVYAGFWIRFCAYIIDLIVLIVLGIPFRFLLVANIRAERAPETFSEGFMQGLQAAQQLSPYLVALLVMTLLYHVFFHGRFGQTPGKMLLKLRVVKPGGEPITYLNAFGRFCASHLIDRVPLIGWIISLVGHIMAGVDIEKRALHDRIAGTRVIYVRK